VLAGVLRAISTMAKLACANNGLILVSPCCARKRHSIDLEQECPLAQASGSFTAVSGDFKRKPIPDA